MELNISIDETTFKDIVDKELKDLSKDKLQEIIYTAITNYLKDPTVMENLLFINRGSYGSKQLVPSNFMVEAGKLINLIPALQEIEDDAIKYLADNRDKILVDAMARYMAAGLFFSNGFKDNVEAILINEFGLKKKNG